MSGYNEQHINTSFNGLLDDRLGKNNKALSSHHVRLVLQYHKKKQIWFSLLPFNMLFSTIYMHVLFPYASVLF